MAVFDQYGIRFAYPDDWEQVEERDDLRVTVTIESPEGGLWSVSLMFDGSDPEDVIDAALDGFREEYDEIDIYEGWPNRADAAETVAGTMGEAELRQVEFVAEQLINSAWLRAIPLPLYTVFEFYQVNDHFAAADLEELEAISRSLTVSADGMTGGDVLLAGM